MIHSNEDADAFSIDADLTSHHIEGIAREGNTPFSCSLISHVEGNLWQGGCRGGINLRGKFKHIVSLYPWECYNPGAELDSFTEVRLYDGPVVPDEAQLFSLALWINVCVTTGPTLVHCQAGLNRSGLLAGLSLVLRGWTAEAAITQLRAQRSPAVLCNKTFEKWLREQELTVAGGSLEKETLVAARKAAIDVAVARQKS
jgi:hypothetical protein